MKEASYESLEKVLANAVAQASRGKGKARHAHEGENFEDQVICQLQRWGLPYDEGQACKKIIESVRLPRDMKVTELLGAINYISAAIIVANEEPHVEKDERFMPDFLQK